MVSFAFLAAMAFSAVPSPLYGLYRARDHFSLFMITVVYVGVGITLSRHVSPKDTILGFAIVVGAGIAASAIGLARRTTT